MTAKVSKYNIIVDQIAGGLSLTLDLAEISESGSARIEHDVGVSARGERFYGVRIDYGRGRSIIYICYQQTETSMQCYTTTISPAETVRVPPIILYRE